MKRIIIASALAIISAINPINASERFIDGLSWTAKYGYKMKQHFNWDFDAGKLFRTDLTKGKRDRNTDVHYGNSYQAPWQTRDVKREWRLGWKGQGAKVGIIDNFTWRSHNNPSHGEKVRTVIKGGYSGGKYVSGIAPAADVTDIQRPPTVDLTQFDVINVSYDVTGNHYARLAAEGNTGRALENSGAVVTIASGNSSTRCDNIDNCSNMGMAVTGNATSGEYIRNPENTAIVVGSTDYRSANKAGLLRKDFIIASSQGPRIDNGHGGYYEMTGTSYSAPRVAATAALIKSKFPKATSIGIKKLILESADGMGKCAWVPKKFSCSDNTYGHGALNIRAALSPMGKLR